MASECFCCHNNNTNKILSKTILCTKEINYTQQFCSIFFFLCVAILCAEKISPGIRAIGNSNNTQSYDKVFVSSGDNLENI